ncbi:MAG: ABC transporter ATP-binding protein [Mycoplasmataceae bacterium]|nr:ABC transporter ATP-binding protein [Mycoplasmataceae bacterium]
MSILKITNLVKTYANGQTGIKNFNIDIAPGDIYALVGHNGAGKTTIIKAIAGIHDFDTGEIMINGVSIRKDPLKCKSMIAYLPDDPELYEYLTGIQFLNFIADVYGISKSLRQKEINNLSKILGMTTHMGSIISSYSHGMKQKLSIIAALIHSPKLLIMDEPFVGLDPTAAFNLKKIIAKYVKAGNSVFFSSHILEVVEKICNKITIIKSGKVVVSGRIKNVVGKKGLESIYVKLSKDE